MDPLAHTLVGATLAQTRLGRATAGATPALIIGANAPDIDAVAMLIGRDLSLGVRRGWTHGVLALALLPLLLTAVIVLADRVLNRHRGGLPRVRVGPLVGLSYLAVLTHPALDWLNTYGIRLLMPFDGRWFYGDALFIVDPWVWLLMATSVVLASSHAALSGAAWIALGTLTTLLVTGFGGVPGAARVVWVAGVSSIVGLRVWGVAKTRRAGVATGCLVVVILYIGSMVVGSRLTVSHVRDWLAERGEVPLEIMAGPVPANPFVRDVIVVDSDHYHFLEVDWLAPTPVRIASTAMPRGPVGPIVDAALKAPQVWGLKTWMRYPAFSVVEHGSGYRVTIQDVRYSRRAGPGLGATVVELDRDLQVLPPADGPP